MLDIYESFNLKLSKDHMVGADVRLVLGSKVQFSLSLKPNRPYRRHPHPLYNVR